MYSMGRGKRRGIRLGVFCAVQKVLCTGCQGPSQWLSLLLFCRTQSSSNDRAEGVRSERVRTGSTTAGPGGGRVDAGAVLVLGELALESLPIPRGHLAEVVLAVLRQLLPPCANDLGERAKVDLPVRLAVPALLGPVLVPVVVEELLLLLLGPLDLAAVEDAVWRQREKQVNDLQVSR
jgi:hypothetical protein